LTIVAAWLFRASSAPLRLKLALPSLMLVSALSASYQFTTLLGRPVVTTRAAMPDRIHLLAFKPVDNDTAVDLWIAEGDATRAYETPLDGETARALRQARGALAAGRPVFLIKQRADAAHATPGLTDLFSADRTGFRLEPFSSTLPPKT
jgi:hypothetical protein